MTNEDIINPLELLTENEHLQQENKQLKNNWNELEKSLKEQTKELNPRELEISQFNIQNDDYTMGQYNVYQNILKKIQELEKGKSE